MARLCSGLFLKLGLGSIVPVGKILGVAIDKSTRECGQGLGVNIMDGSLVDAESGLLEDSDTLNR